MMLRSLPSPAKKKRKMKKLDRSALPIQKSDFSCCSRRETVIFAVQCFDHADSYTFHFDLTPYSRGFRLLFEITINSFSQ